MCKITTQLSKFNTVHAYLKLVPYIYLSPSCYIKIKRLNYRACCAKPLYQEFIISLTSVRFYNSSLFYLFLFSRALIHLLKDLIQAMMKRCMIYDVITEISNFLFLFKGHLTKGFPLLAFP